MLVMLLSLTIWIGFNSIDTGEVNDHEIMRRFVVVPGKENGFLDAKKLEKLNLPSKYSDSSRAAKDAAIIEQLLAGKSWNRNIVRTTLKRYRGVFPIVETILGKKYFQLPELVAIEQEIPKYQHYISAANLMALRSLHYQRQGKIDQSIEEAHRVLRFGHKIKSETSWILISYMIGRAVENIALQRFYALSSETRINAKRSRHISGLIAKYGHREHDSFSESMLGEYRFMANSIEDYYQKTLSERLEYDQELAGIEDRTPNTFRQYLLSYYFHPNETKNLYAKEALRLYGEAKKICKDQEIPPNHEFHWTDLLKPNSLSKGEFGFKSYFKHRCFVNVFYAGVGLVTALKAYEKTNGRLPDTLNQLVPEFIDRIPEDEFDGQPMRYSKEHRWVYSVGSDYVDNGGRKDGYVFKHSYNKPAGANHPTIPVDHKLWLKQYQALLGAE